MEKCRCARTARAGFISVHFGPALVFSTTWNHLFCCCVEDVGSRRQLFSFLFSPLSGSYQFNSRIISKYFFAIQTIWNNRGMVTETQSCIFRFRCRSCCSPAFSGERGLEPSVERPALNRERSQNSKLLQKHIGTVQSHSRLKSNFEFDSTFNNS